MNKLLDNNILELYCHIHYAGYKFYLVGGCVRDHLLRKIPKDFDIVTDMPVDELKDILNNNDWNVNEAGLNFLVMIASKSGNQYEIANFRKDSTYKDGRHPDSVEIGTIDDDSIRRDLTINSLYYDPSQELVVDPTGKGIKDLKDKIIRMNGRAEDRIKEDLLRIMRVYRFAGTLGFEIEKKTLSACRRHFKTMQEKIPAERVKNEIEKLIGLSKG